MRHGHSPQGLPDFDRQLSEKGRQDVFNQANLFSDIKFDKALVSSAARTRETAEIVCQAIGLSKSLVMYQKNIYEASLEKILSEVERTENSVDRLLYIGHNPGVSLLATFLTGSFFSFRPADFVTIQLDTDSWSVLIEGLGKEI